MPQQFVRVTRTAAVFLAFAAGACDSSTDIPTAPEGPIPFNAVAFNSNSVSPTPGQSVSAGSSVSYSADVFYQVTPSEFSQFEDVYFQFWVESWDDENGWEGDLVQTSVLEGTASGTSRFQGTVQVPSISAFCSSYSDLSMAVWLYTSPDTASSLDREVSEKAGGENDFERIILSDVTGATGPTGPCMEHDIWVSDIWWGWGEELIVWVDGLPNDGLSYLRPSDADALARFPIGDTGQEASILLQVPFGEDVAFVLQLPIAASGGLQHFIDGAEGEYGLTSPMNIDFEFAPDDIWDIYGNNGFDFPAYDWTTDWVSHYWFGAGSIMVWNPFLTLPEADQAVDSEANPLGSDLWGVGDWYELPVGYDMNVCASISFDSTDDIDLLLFDGDGNELDRSVLASGTSEFVRADGIAAGSALFLWVAPYLVNTAQGSYEIAAADCGLFASPSQGPSLRVPEGSATLSGPAVSQRRDGNDLESLLRRRTGQIRELTRERTFENPIELP